MSITPAQRARVLERDGFRCRRCGSGADAVLHIDHIVPKSRGGSERDDNLQTLCRDCNMGKRDRPPHPSELRGPKRETSAGMVAPRDPLLRKFALGEPGKAVADGDLGWQSQLVERVGDQYLVQRYSWLSGEPTTAVLVPLALMSGWEFFDREDEWRARAERSFNDDAHREQRERAFKEGR